MPSHSTSDFAVLAWEQQQPAPAPPSAAPECAGLARLAEGHLAASLSRRASGSGWEAGLALLLSAMAAAEGRLPHGAPNEPPEPQLEALLTAAKGLEGSQSSLMVLPKVLLPAE